jgi:long-chain acyl-CoA synthetase
MFPLIAVAEHIAQARQLNDGSPTLPWSSFADFFTSRVSDRRLVNRPAGGDPLIKRYDREHEVAVE